MIGMPWPMRRDHDNERGDPVVRLNPDDPILPRKPTNLPEPVLDDSFLVDEETAALEQFGPLAAWRLAARGYGPDFAAGWSSFVKEQARWHRTLEALRWRYQHGGHG